MTLRQPSGARIEAGKPLGHGTITNVDDQRIDGRPVLGGEDSGNRIVVAGIRTQPVDRLGGKGDELSRFQRLRGAGNVRRRCLQHRHTHLELLLGQLPRATKLGFSKPGLP